MQFFIRGSIDDLPIALRAEALQLEDGWIVDERARGVLGDAVRERDSRFRGIQELHRRGGGGLERGHRDDLPHGGGIAIMGTGWNGGLERDEFHDMCREILVPAMPPNIEHIDVRVPHNELVDRITGEDVFRINIWSSLPAGIGHRFHPPATLFGHGVRTRDSHNGYLPLPTDGFSLVEVNGYVAAFYDAHNLYITFDAVHHGGDAEKKILRSILQAVAEGLPGRHRPADYSIPNYVAMCNHRRQHALQTAEQLMKDLQEQLIHARETMHGLYTEIDVKARELAVIRTMPEVSEKSCRKEWRALTKNPLITELFCIGGTVAATTHLILVPHPNGTSHRLGKFRITVNPDGVKIVNLTDKPNGMDAPHVFNGGICFGTVAAAVDDLLKRREYAALINLVLSFLQTANVEDRAGSHLVDWPKATKEEIAAFKALTEPPKKATKKRSSKRKARTAAA